MLALVALVAGGTAPSWVHEHEKDAVCKSTEYCCPDAKKCLTPTTTSCKDDANACASGEVCCPLTKICVVPGVDCTSPCTDQGTYCCPDVHKCLAPTHPGEFCKDDGDCSSGEACCPLTKVCVAPGADCKPAEVVAASKGCKKHFADAGLTLAWNETIAHAMHSMTVQHLRAFNPSATEQNTIPTVDRSVATFPWTLLSYAPDMPVEDSSFATPQMNLIDHLLSHMDSGHDGLGKYTSGVERIVHEFHMRDLYARVLQIYETLPEPDAALCACLADTKANGIEDAMKVYKFVIFQRGIHTGEFPRLVGAASWAEGKTVWAPWYEQPALTDVAIYLRCAAHAPAPASSPQPSKHLHMDDDLQCIAEGQGCDDTAPDPMCCPNLKCADVNRRGVICCPDGSAPTTTMSPMSTDADFHV